VVSRRPLTAPCWQIPEPCLSGLRSPRSEGSPEFLNGRNGFWGNSEKHKALVPLVGIGCNPVLVKGNKEQFLSWLSDGVWGGEIHFPAEGGPVHWPSFDLRKVFSPATD